MNGKSVKWLSTDMYNKIDFSPDGKYVLVSSLKKPFSYIVPYYRFSSQTVIYSKNGKKIEVVLDITLIEDLPKGFMSVRQGRRKLSWRNDKPASLVFVKALDDGDAEKKVAYRDELFQLDPPFNTKPTSLIRTINRFSNVVWCNDSIAIASDYWWNNRNTKTYFFNPKNNKSKVYTIFDRNYQDRYTDPGNFITKKNIMGSNVLCIKDGYLFLSGPGYSKEGQFPFINKFNISSKEISNVYQSEYTNKFERINDYDVDKNQLLVRIESPNEYTNYFIKDLTTNNVSQLTDFSNPFKSIQDVEKTVIDYKRDDGLNLSAVLYLPIDYDKNTKEKMPMILWAYPREYKDLSSASQNTSNPNKFTYPYYGSPIYWVTRGYVVLDQVHSNSWYWR